MIQTECLLRCQGKPAALEVSVRFLQPTWREIGVLTSPDRPSTGATEPEYRLVPELVVGGNLYQSWQEATERELKLAPIAVVAGGSCAVSEPFSFPASRTFEALSEDATRRAVGVMVRRQEATQGAVEVNASPAGAQCARITVRALNQTPVPQDALGEQDPVILRTFASTHTILRVAGGEFISLIDPPEAQKETVNACRNLGTWPVLVGDEQRGQRDTMLSSPIILYDYPKIAPESNGDYFDGTEIDEMLALRVKTMTDDEKREMVGADALARKLLERTNAIPPEGWMRMHGTMRDVKSPNPEVRGPKGDRMQETLEGAEAGAKFLNTPSASADPDAIKPGDKVLLRPKGKADAFDLMLSGRRAIVEAVERDLENKVHLAVVLEDDPGKDLGFQRQPGHRFFYSLEEVEPLKEDAV